MAGHSKWSNIKHKKARLDFSRGKVFTKLIRELTVAARLGGEHVSDNPRLRAAVDKALGANMSRDTIDRAIARGAGTAETESLEELIYEGYGPGGVAILVETLTDNKNRTVADVRHGFSKNGGNLGTSGSVAYLFQKKGTISFAPGANEDRILEVALEAGADDVNLMDDGSLEVVTSPERFGVVKDALTSAGLHAAASEVSMIAATEAALDFETAEKLMKLVDHLEDLDDVQNVYSNASISDEVMSRL